MPLTITLNRYRRYSSRSPVAYNYSYTFSEDVTTDRGHVYEAGYEVSYGPGLSSLRDMLRLKYPEADVVDNWPKPKRRPGRRKPAAPPGRGAGPRPRGEAG